MTASVRIALLANCQAHGLERILRHCLEDVHISMFLYRTITSPGAAEDVHAQLESVDVVFAQVREEERLGPLRTSLLCEQRANAIVFPNVVFWGCHPDITYIRTSTGILRGPLIDYHSKIIAAAYIKGYTASETVDLFNAFTYARAGYFDAYQQALSVLTREFRSNGIDIKPHYDRWFRSGSFMYTVNHPKLMVLASVAEELCRLARLPIQRPFSQCSETVPDDLKRNVVWPVYPELATRLGFEGSTMFKGAEVKGEVKSFSLDDLVDEYFAQYTAVDPAVLRVEAVQKLIDII